MDNENNYKVSRKVIYGEGYYDSGLPADRFMNSGREYTFTEELKGKIFGEVSVSFRKDGQDAVFSGIWHSHIFTDAEISVLCSGGSVTFETVEGELIYTVTGSLREKVAEVDPFNVPYNSSYKLYEVKEYEFAPEVFPQEYVPEGSITCNRENSSRVYIPCGGELLELKLDPETKPDAAQVDKLLAGGVTEFVSARYTADGKPAGYDGCVLRETVSCGGANVICNMDGSMTEYDTKNVIYRLYYRSVESGAPEVKLFSFAYPDGMDFMAVADSIFGKGRAYDIIDSGAVSKDDLCEMVKDAVNNNVCFSSVWNSHIFTPDEILRLSRGESIEFEYISGSGEIERVCGALQVSGLRCKVNGKKGAVVLCADDILNYYKSMNCTKCLPVFEDGYEYLCEMEFVADGGMNSFIPKPKLGEEFVSYDPDNDFF